MPGFEQILLSYSLKPKDHGWAWQVVDEDGGTVVAGFAADRDVADADIRAAYHAAAARSHTDLAIAA